MLIFLLQAVWLYIVELAGKDLDISVIIKFLLYVSPRLIVLVLPLTILLTSIMVFGNFAENYEFAAMKSTGISLQRAMRSLSVFIVGLAFATFFFANNIIPQAEFKFFNLRRNIAKVKPAFAIAEGQFNQLGDMNIKVAKKSGDRGQYLEEVTIHQKKPNRAGNHTVIKAKNGELISSEDSNILQMVLYDGNYYDEIIPKDPKERESQPHVKSYFEKYTLNIDLGRLNEVDFEDTKISNQYSMLGVDDLSYTIDSLLVDKVKDYNEMSTSLYNRSTVSTLDLNITPNKNVGDTFNGNKIYELFQPRVNIQLIESALNSVNSTLNIINTKKKNFQLKEKNLNKHIIAFYEKFALGIACIILFFIGAPLGALIKKGGFGLPIVVAIVLFLTYHFIGIFAKNSAEDSSLNPLLATWLSTLIMLPLSIYLTNRATKDRSLIDLDSIIIPIKNALAGKKKNQEDSDPQYLDKDSEWYQKLLQYDNEKLINIVKNYHQFEINESHRNSALQILDSRGITEQELRFGGNLINEDFENALRYKTAYEEYSRMALILYFIALVLIIAGAVLNNNGFPAFGKTLIVIGGVSTVLYLIGFLRAYVNQSNFYKVLNKNILTNAVALIILGIPLYFMYTFYFKRKMDNDIKEIT